jgi:hypothetical protein
MKEIKVYQRVVEGMSGDYYVRMALHPLDGLPLGDSHKLPFRVVYGEIGDDDWRYSCRGKGVSDEKLGGIEWDRWAENVGDADPHLPGKSGSDEAAIAWLLEGEK